MFRAAPSPEGTAGMLTAKHTPGHSSKQLLAITLPCSDKVLQGKEMEERAALMPAGLGSNPNVTSYPCLWPRSLTSAAVRAPVAQRVVARMKRNGRTL